MLTKNNVSYPLQIWNETKLSTPEATNVEREIRNKFDQANELAGEVLDELYSMNPQAINKTAANSWAADFLEKIRTTDKESAQQLSPVDLLKQRTAGNKLWSTLATASFLNEFKQNCPQFEGKVDSTASDEELRNYLESLLKDASPEDAQEIQKTIDKLNNTIDAKNSKASTIGEEFNPVAMRQGIRKAVKEAAKTIDQAEKMIGGFDFGDENSSNIARQNNIGNKLMPLLANNPNLAKIGEILGRMKRIANQKLAQKPKSGTDEICGVESGNDFARMIPTEFLYMDDEFENIFISNYFQDSLTMYELKKEPPKVNGPIVCCLDSSGSMASEDRFPWAMALCLTFLHIARKQNRDFALIHFGTNVKRVDYFDKKDPATLEQVLATASFFADDGGTYFDPALTQALEIIQQNKNFNKADIVFLTDGYSKTSQNVVNSVQKMQKENGLKLFSILVGNDAKRNCVESFSTEVVELKQVLQNDENVNNLFAKVG